jgi:pyruvate/2-oxoglutarate dehydrogenase complex dihydrolipoamide acyltransferase (E2) component
VDFQLPPVGEGLIEVELVRWLVRPGDAVARGQGLAEVMSDKATMEVPAPFAGTISELNATPGKKVKVGELFLKYESVGDVVATPGPVGARQANPERERRGGGAPVPAAPTPSLTVGVRR